MNSPVSQSVAPAALQSGQACPKCGHLRSRMDAAPAWQCPNCGIAYNKFRKHRARLAKLQESVAPRAPGSKQPALHDSSSWTLVVSNVVALVIAVLSGWQLVELMLVYWIQSVIIGASYAGRMLSLQRFTTKGLLVNNKPVEATPQSKRSVTFFFLIHFGIFHAVYLAFIVKDADSGLVLDLGLALCVLIFAVNHLFSYRYNLARDAAGTPNLGTLMVVPYMRIVPMHLTILFGMASLSTFGLVFFGVLKTAADVGMHLLEHKVLAKVNKR